MSKGRNFTLFTWLEEKALYLVMGTKKAKMVIHHLRQKSMWKYSILSVVVLFFLSLSHPLFLPLSLDTSENCKNCFKNYYLKLSYHIFLAKEEDNQRQFNLSYPSTAVFPKEIQDNHINEFVPIVTPIHANAEQRKAWLKQELPKITNSNQQTGAFESRVQKLLSEDCDIRLFMTWISSMKNFGHREFLAFESVFKAHPSGCLIILSSSMDSNEGKLLLKPLTDKGYRADAISPDFNFLFKDTPAESWFNEVKKGNVDPGKIPFPQNLSNLLRLAVLHKYGGVYLDTDVIVLKKFSDLKNTIGAQSVDTNGNWSRLNNAVLVFDKKHPLIFEFMKEFSVTFDGSRWGYNGPYMVSRVVKRVAQSRRSYNFTVSPPRAFYPVDWIKIGRFFRQPAGSLGLKSAAAKVNELSNGKTYALHLWNKQSKALRIEPGSIAERLISSHCLFCYNTSIH